MSQLISLQFYSSPEELSSFLVLDCKLKPQAKLDLFSPVFMKLSENLWIYDLKSCRNYWQAQAQSLSLPELLKTLIEEHLALDGDYRACLCPHPWLGLLLLRQMRDRKLQGLSLWESPLSQSLFKSLSWKQWLTESVQLLEFQYGADKAQRAQCLKALRSFHHGMRRLSLKKPWHFREMTSPSLQRRYGPWVAQCWAWTYPNQDHEEQLSLFDQREAYLYDLKKFPWVNYELPNPPIAQRVLEYPINDWELLKGLLQEDLDKLCTHSEFSDETRVCELQWKILLYNFKDLIIPIRFHSPHSLKAELGEYPTALQQFYYSYLSAMKSLKSREDDLDLPEQIPFLAWELSVTQKISMPHQNQSLISLQQRKNSSLEEFSNKLPAPLLSYRLYPDFCPERSYDSKWETEEEEELLDAWRCAAKRRPLFIFKSAKRLSHSKLSPQYFLERSSETWWEKGESSLYFRDYFLIQNQKRQWLWAYRTPEGRWFQHGIYS